MLKIVWFSSSLSWLVFLTAFLTLQVKSATLQISPCTLSTGHGFSWPFKSRNGWICGAWIRRITYAMRGAGASLCYPVNTCLLKGHHLFLLVITAYKSFIWGNLVSGSLELSAGLYRNLNLSVTLDVRADLVAVFCSELWLNTSGNKETWDCSCTSVVAGSIFVEVWVLLLNVCWLWWYHHTLKGEPVGLNPSFSQPQVHALTCTQHDRGLETECICFQQGAFD